MPLYEEEEPLPQNPEVNPVNVKAYPETYRGIAVDTAYVPRSSMLAWIQGSNWRVKAYYAQKLEMSQEPTPLALHREPPYQQYYKIVGMDLKVDQSLDKQANELTRKFSVTGNGHTYPSLAANYGDMFIADVGDGRLGLFTITSSRRETFLRDSTYAIEWKMVGWLTKEQQDNLDLKTQITYYWSAVSLASGCSPYVTEQEQQDGVEFGRMRSEIIRRYISDFYVSDHSTFLVPDQLAKTYDHFVVKAMMAMVDTITDGRMRKIRALNVQSEPVMGQPTIWDTLLWQDAGRFCGNTERAHLVSTRISRWRPELQAIGFSGIPRFVFPIEAPTDVGSQYSGEDRIRPEGIPFQEGRSRRPEPGPFRFQAERNLPFFYRVSPEHQGNKEPWETPADIKPVVVDNYYVFSEAFYYQQTALMSKLEMLSWQMINREGIDKNQLRTVIKCCLGWDNLERFYYHPVLIALLKYASRN